MNDGGPAFPVPLAKGWGGMSLRDWFAGMAMQGMNAVDWQSNPDDIARCAYCMADEMMEARKEKRRCCQRSPVGGFSDLDAVGTCGCKATTSTLKP